MYTLQTGYIETSWWKVPSIWEDVDFLEINKSHERKASQCRVGCTEQEEKVPFYGRIYCRPFSRLYVNSRFERLNHPNFISIRTGHYCSFFFANEGSFTFRNSFLDRLLCPQAIFDSLYTSSPDPLRNRRTWSYVREIKVMNTRHPSPWNQAPSIPSNKTNLIRKFWKILFFQSSLCAWN